MLSLIAPPAPSGVIDVAARKLAVSLGVGDLLRHQPCHGYQNGCACQDCTLREEQPRPKRVRQPWEAKEAA